MKENPVKNISRILLAIDKSEESEKAVDQALQFARNCSAEIVLLSVTEINDELEAMAPDVVEKLELSTKEVLEKAEKKAASQGIKFKAVSHTGEDPAYYIVEEAKKEKADLIIMGKKAKKKGLSKFIMGSVTSKVLNHAPCNIFIMVE